MRKDEAVGNKKKNASLFIIINQLYNNLLTVEPRAVDPHCFDADADPDPGGGEGGTAKNVHPPGKILGTPLPVGYIAMQTRIRYVVWTAAFLTLSFRLNQDKDF
jgi:hypothetical protein